MNQIAAYMAAAVAYVKNLTAPKSVDAITASLRKQVEQLEHVHARSFERADRIAERVAALRAERERLDAEGIKAWRTANKFRALLED